jgi:hypothetical protein
VSVKNDVGVLFMLVCSLLNVGDFRPKVRPELTNRNPRALEYQSSTKVKEGLTLDAEGITETIMSCVRDEGINKLGSIWDGIHTFHIRLLILINK